MEEIDLPSDEVLLYLEPLFMWIGFRRALGTSMTKISAEVINDLYSIRCARRSSLSSDRILLSDSLASIKTATPFPTETAIAPINANREIMLRRLVKIDIPMIRQLVMIALAWSYTKSESSTSESTSLLGIFSGILWRINVNSKMVNKRE